MARRQVADEDKNVIMPYSAPQAIHTFFSLISKETFGRPNASLGLRQVVFALSGQQLYDVDYRSLYQHALEMDAKGEKVSDEPTTAQVLYSRPEAHGFFLLLGKKEAGEANASLGLQRAIILATGYEPLTTMRQQIESGINPAAFTQTVQVVPTGNLRGYSATRTAPAWMMELLDVMGQGKKSRGLMSLLGFLVERDDRITAVYNEAREMVKDYEQVLSLLSNPNGIFQSQFADLTQIKVVKQGIKPRDFMEWWMVKDNRQRLRKIL